MVDAAINQVIIGMNGQIEKLKDANSNVGATAQELQKMRTALSQSTDGVSQTLNQFKTATTTLGESVKDNTTNLQKSTGEISKVATTMQATSATLSNTMQVLQSKNYKKSHKRPRNSKPQRRDYNKQAMI